MDAVPADTPAKDYPENWTSDDLNETFDDGEFTMPNQDVVFEIASVPAVYTVSYEYFYAPDGVNDAPENASIAVGTSVTAASKNTGSYDAGDTVTINGITYTFTGWTTRDVTVTDGTFTMPADHVHFTGRFVQTTAPYTVEHYLMKADGTYGTTADHSHDHIGTIGATVSAMTDAGTHVDSYEYYSCDAGTTGNQHTGTVTADGQLVLKVYYERQKFTVSYLYNGTVPTGASALPDADPYAGTFYWGEENIPVADKAAAPEYYTFSGWHTSNNGFTFDSSHTVTDTSFTMPTENVVFYGSFEAVDGLK